MEKEKKDLSFILILLSTLIGIAVLFQWAIVNGLYVPVRNQAMWEKLLVKGIMFRFLYVILIAGLAFLFPYKKPDDESKKWPLYLWLVSVSCQTGIIYSFSR